jgi:histone-lysine N-methyltransferase SETMAR
MEKVEYRSVIKFLFLQKKTPTTIHEEMLAVYHNDCPSYDVVKHWCKQFKCGRLSIHDEPRSGRPSTSCTDDMIRKVEQIILKDRRVNVKNIVAELGISQGSVVDIIHNELNMTKVSARWIPRLLTPVQKLQRRECSEQLLHLCNRDEDNFFDRLITMDESWIHYFDPETKEASKQWKHVESPPPKKARTQPSAGKVMLSVFWDQDGVILTDYLQKGHTITGQYYSNLLLKLCDEIKKKRRGMLRKGILLLHDNAPAHSSLVACQAARDCGYEILPHPPYSPDLAPSDFFLFPQLKSTLRGRRFNTDNDVITVTEDYFSSKSRGYYRDGIRKVKNRWEKCITLAGSYIEKE